METKQYNTVDKSDWTKGPWQTEPDKMQWQDEATGYPCLLVRNASGALCGYVGVAPSHPLHGKGYDDVGADVHGGLTFADRCRPGETEDHGICHVPGEGEPDDVWWFGFDCAHGGDLIPGADARVREILQGVYKGEQYRTVDYVQAECKSLAQQLKEQEV